MGEVQKVRGAVRAEEVAKAGEEAMTSFQDKLDALLTLDVPLLASEYALHAVVARLALARDLLADFETGRTNFYDSLENARAILAKLDSEGL